MPSQNDQSDSKDFSYFISHNGSILVASLSGFCEGDAAVLLVKCKTEIEERITDTIQGVVLNFSGVTGIANDLVPFWAQLQSTIRSHQVELRVCGVESNLKEKLNRMGILRSNEASLSLKEALPEIVVALRRSSHSRHSPAKKVA